MQTEIDPLCYVISAGKSMGRHRMSSLTDLWISGQVNEGATFLDESNKTWRSIAQWAQQDRPGCTHPSKYERPIRMRRAALITTAATCVVLFFYYVFSGDGSKPYQPTRAQLMEATAEQHCTVATRELAKQRLKAPSTAQFGTAKTIYKDGTCTVMMQVTAKNPFGVPLSHVAYASFQIDSNGREALQSFELEKL